MGGTATATVTVIIIAIENPPIAYDDSATTDEDTAITIDVLDNDMDPDGHLLTIDAVTQGNNGSVLTDGQYAVYTL